MLSKKASKRIADLINQIQCGYIMLNAEGQKDNYRLWRNSIDSASVALLKEFNIQLPGVEYTLEA